MRSRALLRRDGALCSCPRSLGWDALTGIDRREVFGSG
jgi:hypothetical protein